MRTFIIGVTGGVGRLLAVARGDQVTGLVRQQRQQADLAAEGVYSVVGDLTKMNTEDLASVIRRSGSLVFAAGSNDGAREPTDDGQGLATAIDAARGAGARRFVSVSVLPEAQRELVLDDAVELYIAVKKAGDVELSQTDLDWVVLRPSMLVDKPGVGSVMLGAAAIHGEIARADVAATAAELLHEQRISRQIVELDRGLTPIRDAVLSNVHRPGHDITALRGHPGRRLGGPSAAAGAESGARR